MTRRTRRSEQGSANGSVTSLPVTTIDWLIVAFHRSCSPSTATCRASSSACCRCSGSRSGRSSGRASGRCCCRAGSHSQYAPLFGLVGALLAGGVLASGFEGLGLRARAALRLPGLRAVDGLLGAAFTACVGLGIAWIVGAVALQSSGSTAAAPRHPALGDPPRARPAAAAVGPDPPRARAVRPAALGPRAGSRCRRADARDPRRRRRPRRARERRARRRLRVRARDRGQRLGRRARTHRDQRPCRRGRERHRRADRRRARRACPAQCVVVRSARRHRHARVRGLDSAAARRWTPTRSPGPRPRSSAIRSTARSTPSPDASARPSASAPTTPTATGRCIRTITSLRGRVRPGNSGGPMVDAAGRSSRPCSPRSPGAASAGTAASPSRTRSSAQLPGRWPGTARPCTASAAGRATRNGGALASRTGLALTPSNVRPIPSERRPNPVERRPTQFNAGRPTGVGENPPDVQDATTSKTPRENRAVTRRPVRSACETPGRHMPGSPRNPVQATPWAGGGLQHRPPLGV